MKYYDGMQGRVEQVNRNSLFISTRGFKYIDYLTMGFYPKPKYEQIGVYCGNTTGIIEGAIVEIYFRKQRKWKEIFQEMGLFKAIKEIIRNDNIERVVLVKQGEINTTWKSFKECFKI